MVLLVLVFSSTSIFLCANDRRFLTVMIPFFFLRNPLGDSSSNQLPAGKPRQYQQWCWLAIIGVLVWFDVAHAGPTPTELLTPNTPLISGAEVAVTVADYQQALLALPLAQRRSIETDPTQLREFLFELYTERNLARAAQQRGLDKQPEVQAKLALITRKVLVEAIAEQERAKTDQKQPDLTALAEEYYLTHRKDYVQPERIKVAHILWKIKCDCEDGANAKRDQATATLQELQAGANFADLARKYSEDSSNAANGGSLGQWISHGQLVKPFEEAAFALPEPGAISEVIKTDFGYHIIKLIAHEPAGTIPFEEMKAQIIKELANQYKSTVYKAFIAPYYPTAVQFKEAAINAVMLPTPGEKPPAPLPSK